MNHGFSSFAARPALKAGTKTLLAIILTIYLLQLALSYAYDFRPDPTQRLLDLVAISLASISRGHVFTLVTYMWIHSLDHLSHVIFNSLVLFWFGPELEQRWGTRRFIICYLLFALGGGVFYLLYAIVLSWLFSHQTAPAIGASGAISGLLAAFFIIHWSTPLRLLFLELRGWGWLLVLLFIDLLRLIAGEPIAVQVHWGGMLTAAIIIRPQLFDPRLLLLRLKFWRSRRRLRLLKPDRHDDPPTYH